MHAAAAAHHAEAARAEAAKHERVQALVRERASLASHVAALAGEARRALVRTLPHPVSAGQSSGMLHAVLWLSCRRSPSEARRRLVLYCATGLTAAPGSRQSNL